MIWPGGQALLQVSGWEMGQRSSHALVGSCPSHHHFCLRHPVWLGLRPTPCASRAKHRCIHYPLRDWLEHLLFEAQLGREHS